MDNPRYERYLTTTPRRPNKWELRARHLCDELARKIGLRQLKGRTALIAAVLFAAVAGFGLARSGVFRAPDAAAQKAATGGAGGALSSPAAPAPAQGTETTVTVHVVVDQNGAVSASADGDVASASASAGGSSAQTADGKINLNTADETTLETLPGVGPATAQKIIADRKANGPFASPEDLMRVSGIGPKKYDAVKDLVTTR
ncbi:MAG: helix-hairpin-helix domain-containing protein [Coriobacteriia bacterium]|nr:helix-hairpin-helix domain-containing protein [Coriobacteriia bacterium]